MKKLSETYTLSYLAKHKSTRDIVFKHLNPLGVDKQQVNQVHATLSELADTNTGGGIPYDVMQTLTEELDKIQLRMRHL